jgi:hypothetical protein
MLRELERLRSLPLVLAYHGCKRETARELLGGSSFRPSGIDYDWLGAGSYFWENDLLRAYQWATEPGRNLAPSSVVGAALEPGNWLDLTTRSGIEAVKRARDQLVSMAPENGYPIPSNENPLNVPGSDKIIRRLDCAVMNHLFDNELKTVQQSDPKKQPYVPVRALFPEESTLYPGAGFRDKTQIQICVREPKQIFGVFGVPEWQSAELGLPNFYLSD